MFHVPENQHKILYEREDLIKTTLDEQFPGRYQNVASLRVGNLPSSLPVSAVPSSPSLESGFRKRQSLHDSTHAEQSKSKTRRKSSEVEKDTSESNGVSLGLNVDKPQMVRKEHGSQNVSGAATESKYQWNQCRLLCPLCPEALANVQLYRTHLYRVHRAQLFDNPYKKESHRPNHQCLICRSQVRFDCITVKKHLEQVHKVSLLEYELKFSSKLDKLFRHLKEVQTPKTIDSPGSERESQDKKSKSDIPDDKKSTVPDAFDLCVAEKPKPLSKKDPIILPSHNNQDLSPSKNNYTRNETSNLTNFELPKSKADAPTAKKTTVPDAFDLCAAELSKTKPSVKIESMMLPCQDHQDLSRTKNQNKINQSSNFTSVGVLKLKADAPNAKKTTKPDAFDLCVAEHSKTEPLVQKIRIMSPNQNHSNLRHLESNKEINETVDVTGFEQQQLSHQKLYTSDDRGSTVPDELNSFAVEAFQTKQFVTKAPKMFLSSDNHKFSLLKNNRRTDTVNLTDFEPVSVDHKSINAERKRAPDPDNAAALVPNSSERKTIVMTDPIISPSFDHQKYSAWADQCSYACQLCGKEVHTKSLLQLHLKNIHNREQDLKAITPSATVIKECPVPSCNSLEEYSKTSLSKHVGKSHSMSLNACYIKHVLKEEAMPSEMFHKWFSQLEYKCKICSKQCMYMQALEAHVQSSHNLTIKQYVYLNGKIKPKTDVCPIRNCRKTITMDKSYIVKHAKSHSMTPLQLFQVFAKDVLAKPRSFEKLKSVANPKALKFEWNQCRIYCSLCPEVLSGVLTYGKHLASEHDAKISRNPYKPESVRQLHKCLLCHLPVGFEHVSVTAHLEQFHHISLKKYEEKFSSELEEVFRSLTEKNDLKSVPVNPNPSHGRNKKSKKYNKVALSSSSRAGILVDHKHVQFTDSEMECLSEEESSRPRATKTGKPKAPKIVKKKVKVKNYPWDQCHLYCPLCPEILASVQLYREHLSKKHNAGLFDTPFKKESLQPNHTCLLCQREVRFDFNTVKRHLQEVHYNSLSDYVLKFSTELDALFRDLMDKTNVKTTNLNVSSSLQIVHKNSEPLENDVKNPSEQDFVVDFEVEEEHGEEQEQIEDFSHSSKDISLDIIVTKDISEPETDEETRYEWNRCLLLCPLCPETLTDEESYQKHISVVHKSSLDKHPCRKGSFCPKHKCLICMDKMEFVQNKVEQHLDQMHGISIQKYEYEFSSELNTLFNEMMGRKDAKPASIQYPKQIEISEPETDEETRYEWNRCLLLCPLCPETLTDEESYQKHISVVHKVSPYKHPYRKGSFRPKHKCLICMDKMEFVQIKVEQHLDQMHGISLPKYEYYFSSELNTLFNEMMGRKDDKPASKQCPKQMIKKSQQKIEKTAEKSIGAAENLSEDLQALDSKRLRYNSSKHRYPWSQCRLYCPICYKAITCVKYYQEHITLLHAKPIEDYPCMERSVRPNHECFICESQVEFDRFTVKKHVEQVHRISLPEYERRFSSELDDLFSNLDKRTGSQSLEINSTNPYSCDQGPDPHDAEEDSQYVCKICNETMKNTENIIGR